MLQRIRESAHGGTGSRPSRGVYCGQEEQLSQGEQREVGEFAGVCLNNGDGSRIGFDARNDSENADRVQDLLGGARLDNGDDFTHWASDPV